MTYIDANIVLRYLLNDSAELSTKATQIIDNDNVSYFLCDGVCAEIVYVLQKVYSVEREIIQTTLTAFFQKSNIFVSDFNVIAQALTFYAVKNIDFIDSILLAYNKINKSKVLTFDKKLAKFLK